MRPLPAFLLFSLALQLAVPMAVAEIFKTTDKQGRVIYTDQPAASDTKAKVVELPHVNTLPPVQVTPYNPAARTDAVEVVYQVTLISPKTGITLMPNDRNLNVVLTINQPLQEGHTIAYFIDSTVAQESTSLNATLVEPPRGEHTLHAAVRDKTGKVLGETSSINFIVLRPIVKQTP